MRQLSDVADWLEKTSGCGSSRCAERGASNSGRESFDHPRPLADFSEVWSEVAGGAFDVGDCDAEVFSVVGIVRVEWFS